MHGSLPSCARTAWMIGVDRGVSRRGFGFEAVFRVVVKILARNRYHFPWSDVESAMGECNVAHAWIWVLCRYNRKARRDVPRHALGEVQSSRRTMVANAAYRPPHAHQWFNFRRRRSKQVPHTPTPFAQSNTPGCLVRDIPIVTFPQSLRASTFLAPKAVFKSKFVFWERQFSLCFNHFSWSDPGSPTRVSYASPLLTILGPQ